MSKPPTDLAGVEHHLTQLETEKKDAERRVREQTEYLRQAERSRDRISRDVMAWQTIANTLKNLG